MTLQTCPDCGRPFKMRERGRCPHCQTTLLVGREIHDVVLSKTRGWFWDGATWIPIRSLVGARVTL